MMIICLFLSMFTYGCSGKKEPDNTASSGEADSSIDKTQDITQNNDDDNNSKMNGSDSNVGISDDRNEQTKVVVEIKQEYEGETWLNYQFNKYGDMLYYEDRNGWFTRLGYDALKNVYFENTSQTGTADHWNHFEIDADYIDSQTDKYLFDHGVFDYVRRSFSNLHYDYLEVYEDGECKTKYYREYDSNRKVVHSVDLGGEVYWQYDDSGNLIRKEKTDGSWTSWEYDATGNKIREESSDGNWTSWEYDATGNKIRKEKSNGSWTSWEYDAAGNKIREEESDGSWTSWEYDAAGNKIREEKSDGSWTSWEYDAAGNETREERSDGWWESYEYDTAGNKIREEGSSGWCRKYDENGNRTYNKDTDGTWTKWEYDVSGNVINSEGSDGSWKKWSYDDNNNFIIYETSDGKWEHREYDKEGRLTYIEGCSTDQSTLLSITDIIQVPIYYTNFAGLSLLLGLGPEGPEIKEYGDQFWIKIEYDDEGNIQYTDSKGYKAIAEGWQYGGKVEKKLFNVTITEWTGWEHGKDKKECWVWNPKGELEWHASYQYYK